MTDSIQLDPERQVKAKVYARLQRRLMLLSLALGVLYLLAWLLLGWSSSVKSNLLLYIRNEWLLVAGYGLIFALGYYILDLPLSYYSEFILAHRFDISNQTLKSWVSDQIRGLLIGGLLGGLVLEIIYAILRRSPDTWWLWAAAFLLIINVLLANLGPILLMPLFYKIKPLGDEHQELASKLMDLSNRAGARVSGVFLFDMSRRTKAANAALTGLGKTRRIILGDTLIQEFTPDEIETVMAHELGHHVHRDIPIGMAIETIMNLVGLYLAALGLKWGTAAFGFSGPADIAAFPLFALIMGIFGLVTLPLGNAFSRWRERRADAFALQLTQKGSAYASALTRLANQNLADADPEPWVEWLLYSHPPLGKRIKMAESSER